MIHPIKLLKKYSAYLLATVVCLFPALTHALNTGATLASAAVSPKLSTMGDFIVRNLLMIIYYLFIYVMGIFSTFAMRLLIWVASFSGFTNMAIINDSWTIVRDFSNLLFIVILLFIAFGTILKIESYSYQKLLPKMIIAAVLVNFSKMICGICVDASQIVMLTFVNAFRDAASRGFYTAFRINDLVSLGMGTELSGTTEATNWNTLQYLVAVIAAGLMLTILTSILLVMTVVLLARMVIIWVLTILSPLAYALSVLPATQKYTNEWWSTFGRYLVVGPFIAFFIWLSLFVVVKSDTTAGPIGQVTIVNQGEITDPAGANISKALDPGVMTNFLIAVVLLTYGLKQSSSMATEVGKYTGKVGDLPKAAAGKYWKGLGGAAGSYAKRRGKWAGSDALDYIKEKSGIDLNLKRRLEATESARKDRSKKRSDDADNKARAGLREGGYRGWLKTWKANPGIAYREAPGAATFRFGQASLYGEKGNRLGGASTGRVDFEKRKRLETIIASKKAQEETDIEAEKNKRVKAQGLPQQQADLEDVGKHINELLKLVNSGTDIDPTIQSHQDALLGAKINPASLAGLNMADEKDQKKAVALLTNAENKNNANIDLVKGQIEIIDKQVRDDFDKNPSGFAPHIVKNISEKKEAERQLNAMPMPVIDPKESMYIMSTLSDATRDFDTKNSGELVAGVVSAMQRGKASMAMGLIKKLFDNGQQDALFAKLGLSDSPNRMNELFDLFRKGGSSLDHNGLKANNLGASERTVNYVQSLCDQSCKSNRDYRTYGTTGTDSTGSVVVRKDAKDPARQNDIHDNASYVGVETLLKNATYGFDQEGLIRAITEGFTDNMSKIRLNTSNKQELAANDFQSARLIYTEAVKKGNKPLIDFLEHNLGAHNVSQPPKSTP